MSLTFGLAEVENIKNKDDLLDGCDERCLEIIEKYVLYLTVMLQ
jgi:hypothetical protein